jgi:hypothetical protein
MVYTIASPDEYLAITGAGVKTLKITKSAWVWPFQRVRLRSQSSRTCSILTNCSVNDFPSSLTIILYVIPFHFAQRHFPTLSPFRTLGQ